MLLGNLTIATKLRLMAAISTLVLIALSGYLLAEEYQINRTARQTAVRQTSRDRPLDPRMGAQAGNQQLPHP